MKLELMGDKEEAIRYVFPDMSNINLCSERAIITGTNVAVNDLNEKILKVFGYKFLLHSVTRLASEDTHLGQFLTEESLHSLK